MKHFYILSVFFILFSAEKTSAQNEYFLNNPEWMVHTYSYPSSDPDTYESYFTYSIVGDTSMAGFVYKKVSKTGVTAHYYGSPPPSPTWVPFSSNPDFYIRSAGKEIYYRLGASFGEDFSFDFDLAVGDSVHHLPMGSGGSIPLVVSIDSIFTPFGYRKSFYLNSGTYIYEGIGSTGGLIEPAMGVFLSGTCSLNCYSLNGSRYWPGITSCDIPTGLSSQENETRINVFPNPFSDKIILQNTTGNEIYELINAVGQVIFSGKNIDAQSFSELPAGIYLLKMKRDDVHQTIKLVHR